MKRIVMAACALVLVGCGGAAPPPKSEESAVDTHRSTGPAPVVQQELGSIDEREVSQTFNKLQGQLAKCQTEGRDRVEYLSGDVKVFLRIDQSGKVRYGYFEESSLGDHETEKCILSVFSSAAWPKPIGGEAEVRNGFGFDAAGERPPTSWGPEKVTVAIEESKDVRSELDKCKASGLRVTGYVVHDDGAADAPPAPTPAKKKNGKKPAAAKEEKKPHGKFSAIGVASPTKEGAEKVECVIDALRPLKLPSPGSYAAKVAFTL